MTSISWKRSARLGSALLLVALLVLALRRLDLARLALELRAVRLPWIVAAVAFFAAVLPLWALQWRILAPPAAKNRFPVMLGVVAVSSSLLNTTVFLMGEAAAVFLLVTRVGLERSAALSVFAMDQLLVGLAKLALIAVAARALVLPGWMSAGVTALAAGVLLLTAGTLFVAWKHEAMAVHAGRLLPPRGARALAGAGHALAPLRSVRRSSGALALALAKMLVEVVAIVCVQHAFGAALPPASAVVVLAALGLATAVPVVPGHVGTYEGVVVLVYAGFGVPAEQALAMALVQHACQFTALALPGYRWIAAAATPSNASASR
jgi:hypothetical protein